MKYIVIILISILLGVTKTVTGSIRTGLTCENNGKVHVIGETVFAGKCVKCRCVLNGDGIETRIKCHTNENCLKKKEMSVESCYYGNRYIKYGEELQVTKILRCSCSPDLTNKQAKCRLHFGKVKGEKGQRIKSRKARFLTSGIHGYQTPTPPAVKTKGTTPSPPPFTIRVPTLPASADTPPPPSVTTHSIGTTKSPPPPVVG